MLKAYALHGGQTARLGDCLWSLLSSLTGRQCFTMTTVCDMGWEKAPTVLTTLLHIGA